MIINTIFETLVELKKVTIMSGVGLIALKNVSHFGLMKATW